MTFRPRACLTPQPLLPQAVRVGVGAGLRNRRRHGILSYALGAISCRYSPLLRSVPRSRTDGGRWNHEAVNARPRFYRNRSAAGHMSWRRFCLSCRGCRGILNSLSKSARSRIEAPPDPLSRGCTPERVTLFKACPGALSFSRLDNAAPSWDNNHATTIGDHAHG